MSHFVINPRSDANAPILLFNDLMQIMASLVSHVGTDSAFLIDELGRRPYLDSYLRRNLEALPGTLAVAEEHLKCFQELLHGDQAAKLLSFLIDRWRRDACADLVRTDCVQRDLLFKEDLAERTNKPHNSAGELVGRTAGNVVPNFRLTVLLRCTLVWFGGYRTRTQTLQRQLREWCLATAKVEHLVLNVKWQG